MARHLQRFSDLARDYRKLSATHEAHARMLHQDPAFPESKRLQKAARDLEQEARETAALADDLERARRMLHAGPQVRAMADVVSEVTGFLTVAVGNIELASKLDDTWKALSGALAGPSQEQQSATELTCPHCGQPWSLPAEVPEHLRSTMPCPTCLRPIYDELVAEVQETARRIEAGEVDAPPGPTPLARAMQLLQQKYNPVH